jgi:hypothetical protein
MKAPPEGGYVTGVLAHPDRCRMADSKNQPESRSPRTSRRINLTDQSHLSTESVTAHACGALGCRTTGPLYLVRNHDTGQQRTVCRPHADRLLRRWSQ